MAGAMLLVIVLAASVGDEIVAQLVAHRPDPAVAMPDADELVEREGLSPEARRDALAPFDPTRTRCTPTGCERWRRPTADWVDSATVSGGNLVLVERDEVIAVDMHTGEERWRSPVPEATGSDTSETESIGFGMANVMGNASTVAIANRWGVWLLSAAGEVRWQTDLETPSSSVWVSRVTDEVVVLVHEEDQPGMVVNEDGTIDETTDGSAAEEWAVPMQRVTVLDAWTGELRWALDPVVQVFSEVSGDLVAVFDGTAVRWLDTLSGGTVSSLRTSDQPEDHTWVHRLGDHYAVTTWSSDDHGRTLLVDGRDLDVLVDLEGAVVASADVDDVVVLLLGHDSGRGPLEREALALGSDGAIRWRLPLPPTSRNSCCPSVIGLEDGLVRIADGGGVEPVVLDAASGTRQDHDPLARLADADEDESWQLRPGLVMQRTGPLAFTFHDLRGRQLTVQGEAWPLYLTDSAPPGAPILLLGRNELVAVEFPP
jgi:outer membrane protein assembly factor BamB